MTKTLSAETAVTEPDEPSDSTPSTAARTAHRRQQLAVGAVAALAFCLATFSMGDAVISRLDSAIKPHGTSAEFWLALAVAALQAGPLLLILSRPILGWLLSALAGAGLIAAGAYWAEYTELPHAPGVWMLSLDSPDIARMNIAVQQLTMIALLVAIVLRSSIRITAVLTAGTAALLVAAPLLLSKGYGWLPLIVLVLALLLAKLWLAILAYRASGAAGHNSADPFEKVQGLAVATVAVALFAMAVNDHFDFVYNSPSNHGVIPVWSFFFAVLSVAPLALIRQQPLAAWVTACAALLTLSVTFGFFAGEHPTFAVIQFVTLATLFAVVLTAGARPAALVWIGTGLVLLPSMVSGWGITRRPPGMGIAEVIEAKADNVISGLGLVLITGVIAVLVRRLRGARRQLAQTARLAAEQRTRSAVLEDRARIARELHDVVAHHLSLVVVQSTSAPVRLAGVPAAAAAEFESIGETARAALNEIRTMLGVLRSDGADAELSPQPCASDIVALLENTARAGAPVTWQINGQLTGVGAATGLALYRILQESLANASRHAPHASIGVDVVRDPDGTVRLRVHNPGSGPATATEGGNGIAGMHERARAALGTLTAGWQPDGNFVVQAQLPPASSPRS